MALHLVGQSALTSLFSYLYNQLIPIGHSKSSSIIWSTIWGVDEELEALQHELSSIQDVLSDAERRRTTEKGISSWLDDLQDLAYEMEDIVDDMNTERISMEVHAQKFPKSNQVSNFSKVSDKFMEVKFNEQIKGQINKVLERLSVVAKRADALGLKREIHEGATGSFSRRQTSPSVDRSEVYGRENDTESVMKLIGAKNTGKNKYDVICLVGTGGIGKTTLAQLIFNDKQLKNDFGGKISWACVSDVFDVAKVTRDLLECYTGTNCSLTSLASLQLQLENMLRDQKFFLVLDDIWSTMEWNTMKGPLSACGEGSKILITTRSRSVAKAISKREPYEVRALKEEHSWALFQDKAFADEDEDEEIDERLTEIGGKIVKKCGGLPLAIKVIGAILADAALEKWESILNSEFWQSVGSDEEIFPALRLSYYVLPSHLKRCFEYLSLFPTDSRLPIDKIVSIWIAEGLVEAEKNRLPEDIGNGYYQDLQNRCLIQMNGKMHDLVHSLACLVSGKYYCRVTNNTESKDLFFATARRVSFSGSKKEDYDFSSIVKAKGIRSLLNFGCKLQPLVDHLSNSRFLRVLDLSDGGLMNLPDSMGNLKHLRYLNLSFNRSIILLPDAICNLYNLQVLLLEVCSSLERIPEDIGNLLNLRSIKLSQAPISTLPNSFWQLTQLENLHIYDCKKLTHLSVEIGTFTKLRFLSFAGLPINELPESICRLQDLRELNISYCTNLVRVPNDLGNLSNLCKLRCNGCSVTLPESISSITFLQEVSNRGGRRGVAARLPRHMSRLKNIKVLQSYSVGREEGQGVGELKSLNKITGLLKITDLDNISSMEEATLANLKGKKHIEQLILSWKDISSEDENEDDGIASFISRDKESEVKILEALEPHENLAALSLTNYFGDRFPIWLLDGRLQSLTTLNLAGQHNIIKVYMEIPSLIDLDVVECPNLMELSILSPKLINLKVAECENLTILTLPPHLRRLSLESLPFPTLADLKFPPALHFLYISKCKQLRSLAIEASTLPNLCWLQIYGCKILKSLFKDGRFPVSLGNLSCEDCPQLNFITDGQQGMQDLNRLDRMQIRDYQILNMEQGMKDLNRLEAMDVHYHQILEMELYAGLPANLGFLEIRGTMTDITYIPANPPCFCSNIASTLKELFITDFPSLTTLPNNLHEMTSLISFQLSTCPQLVSIPNEGLPPLLQLLTISRCDQLLLLPANISTLQRLNDFTIHNCPRLQVRPDDRLPPNLETLSISGCPALQNQLRKEGRNDWLLLMQM